MARAYRSVRQIFNVFVCVWGDLLWNIQVKFCDGVIAEFISCVSCFVAFTVRTGKGVRTTYNECLVILQFANTGYLDTVLCFQSKTIKQRIGIAFSLSVLSTYSNLNFLFPLRFCNLSTLAFITSPLYTTAGLSSSISSGRVYTSLGLYLNKSTLLSVRCLTSAATYATTHNNMICK